MEALRSVNRQKFAFFLCLLIPVGLLFAPAVLSICMAGLLAVGLFDLQWRPAFRFGFNPELAEGWQRFRSRPAYWAITLLFWMLLIGSWHITDAAYLAERLRIKLPFLLLPLAFAFLPAFSKKQYHSLYYWLLVLLFLSCIGIGINFLMYKAEIIDQIKRGQAMPTPGHHIRFSLLLALATVAGGVLFSRSFYLKSPRERYLIAGMTLFCFVFMHVLSVRSGLAVLYMAIGVLSLRYIWQSRRWGLGIVVLAGLCAMPVLAYQLVPSFRAKVGYARYDFQMYKKGEGGTHYSDSGRLFSLQLGWRLFREKPLTGTGAGNLKKEVLHIYQTEFPQMEEQRMPHNQYLSVLAGTGIVGFVLFLIALYFAFRGAYRDPILLALLVILLASFLVENTIENAEGVAIFSFFTLFGRRLRQTRQTQ